MRTVYLQRWCEDLDTWSDRVGEDFHKVMRAENDAFIDARSATSVSGGLLELAEMLGLSAGEAHPIG
jgi:hypothetical protein